MSTTDARGGDGSTFDEIESLSRANRANADPDRERRLVELRHTAFGELDLTPGRPSWPPDLADPFPDVDGLPEIPASELSGAVLGGAIVNHGCLRVNRLIDETAVARFRDHIERAFDARDRMRAGAPAESVAPSYVPFEVGRAKAEGFGQGGFIRAVDMPSALCELVDVFADTGTRAAIEEYFNERPVMIANKWVLRRTASGKIGPDFHQDGAFLGEGIRTVDCWIALSDCGPGTGRPAIDLIARRFDSILEAGDAAAFTWSLTEETVRAAAPGAPIVSPVFRAGDAMFFDERLPHRTSVGLDLTTRYAIESWFVAPSSYPAKHEPVVL